MSARLAPLPPSRSFMPALPSALPLPKKYTRLTALAARAEPLVPLGRAVGVETRDLVVALRDRVAVPPRPFFFAMVMSPLRDRRRACVGVRVVAVVTCPKVSSVTTPTARNRRGARGVNLRSFRPGRVRVGRRAV